LVDDWLPATALRGTVEKDALGLLDELADDTDSFAAIRVARELRRPKLR
jgi:hypothetical protein